MAEHLNSRSAPVMGLMGIKSDQGAADMKHNNYILCLWDFDEWEICPDNQRLSTDY